MSKSLSNFETSIASLKACLMQISTSSQKSPIEISNLLKLLYEKLSLILIECGKSQKSELLTALEEIFFTKNVTLSKAIQALILSIYKIILLPDISPGYIVRNIFTSLINVLLNRSVILGGKECIYHILSHITIQRYSDCGSMVTDVITVTGKIINKSDNITKISVLSSFNSIVKSCGNKFSDCFPEIIKLCSKYSTDKNYDIRSLIAQLLSNLSTNSNNFTSISSDTILPLALKGLDDENSVVQNEFCQTTANIFFELILSHIEEEKKSKQVLARGLDLKKEPVRRSSIAKLTAAVSLKRKLLEEYDYNSVLDFLFKQFIKSTGNLRISYLFVIKYLIDQMINLLSKKDIETTILNLVELIKDPQILALSYEEQISLKIRISFIIRSSIISNITEPDQIIMMKFLIHYISSNSEARHENEIQLVAGEIEHLVSILGESIASLVDDIQAACLMLLRNLSFGVRMSAACVLKSISIVIPIVAVNYLRDSLANAVTQGSHIAKSEGIDVEALDSLSDVSHASQNLATGSRRKSTKESERLQRLYFFHGQTLVISCILKNQSKIPTGLSSQILTESLEFGIGLLKQFQRCPLSNRHVLCSLVRAGAHIVASSMVSSYSAISPSVGDLVSCCCDLFQETSTTSSESTKTEELMFEIIGVEAALICIASLLWHYSKEIANEGNVLSVIIEGLETAFRAIKGKYQQKFRQHFRFRALHILLLECFSWLPPEEYSNSCQQIFVEALRVLRDSLSLGYECSSLNEFINSDWHSYLGATYNRSSSNLTSIEQPLNEDVFILRLERYCTILQKRESEAYLSAFNNDNLLNSNLHLVPCASLDARTIDSSVNLIAKTMQYQELEYQEKAIQLCSQAISQYVKGSNNIGIFTSEEDRRKREMKNYLINKNVIFTLCSIVNKLSFADKSVQLGPQIIEQLIDMLLNPNIDIKFASAYALEQIVLKNVSFADMITSKLTVPLKAALSKKTEAMADYGGFVLVLSLIGRLENLESKTRSAIQLIIIDCANKLDSSLIFRSFSLLSLSTFITNRGFGYGSQNMKEDLDLIISICKILESHLVFIGTSYLEQTYTTDILFLSLLKVLNSAMAIILYLDPTSYLIKRLVDCWNLIQSCSLDSLAKEVIDFIVTILGFPINILDLNKTANILMDVIKSKKRLNFYNLKDAVIAIKLLVMKDASIVCTANLNTELFRLLDYSINSAHQSSYDLWWGIECRNLLSYCKKDEVSLKEHISDAIESLLGVQIHQKPEVYGTRWILFFRAVCLNLRSKAAGKDVNESKINSMAIRDESDEVNQEGDDDDDAGNDDFNDFSSAKQLPSNNDFKNNSLSPSQNSPVNSSLSIAQYIEACREQSLQKASELNSTRSKVKSKILKYTLLAFSLMNSSTICTSLEHARTSLQQIINASTDTNSLIETAPLNPLFYLQDFVNFACACATFTIDDKPLTSIQLPSINLLASLCLVYLNHSTSDSDSSSAETIDSSLTSRELFLEQFISQIVSAVRPCLSSKWTGYLLWYANNAIFILFMGGYLKDKVLVKRLGKLIYSSYEIPDPSNHIILRPNISQEVSQEVSIVEHIITAASLAKLYILTKNYSFLDKVDPGCRSIILSFFDEKNFVHLCSIWYAIILDAARILQGNRIWPPGSIEIDCRRGGILYPPTIKATHLQRHLELALPICLSAYSMIKDIPVETFSVIFSIARYCLNDIQADKKDIFRGRNKHDRDNSVLIESFSKGTSDIELDSNIILGTFSNLAENLSRSDRSCINYEEWSYLLKYVILDMNQNDDFKENSKNKNSNIEIKRVPCFDQIVDLLTKLFDNLLQTEEASNEYHSLWLWVWVSTILMLHRSIPGLFTYEESLEKLTLDPGTGNNIVRNFCVFPAVNKSYITPVGIAEFPKHLALLFGKIASHRLCEGDMLIYTARLFIELFLLFNVNLGPSKSPADSSKKSFLDELGLVFENFIVCKFISSNDLSSKLSEISNLIMDELLHLFNLKKKSLYQSSDSSVIETLFRLWRIVLIKSNMNLPAPIQLQTILLACNSDEVNNDMIEFFKSLLTSILIFIKSDPQVTGKYLSAYIFPVILMVLSNPAKIEDSLHLLFAQIIFLCFSLIEEAQKRNFIGCILSPLSRSLINKIETSSTLVLFCGKGLTHLARNYPENFKEHVLLLSPENKQALQASMASSVQNEQLQAQKAAASDQSTSGSIGIGMVKKLDFAKFQKNPPVLSSAKTNTVIKEDK